MYCSEGSHSGTLMYGSEGSHSGTLMYGSEGSHSGTLMYIITNINIIRKSAQL